MANGYTYITPAMAGSTLFPGESFTPIMTVEGSIAGRPVAASPASATPTIATAGVDVGSINWAVVLIVIGLAIIVGGKD